jgi:putative hydrolase of the HAD superfamily
MKNIKAVLFDLDDTLFPFLKIEKPIKNVKLTIQKIKKSGYKVGVVSNCDSHEASEKINVLGINNFVDIVITPKTPYEKKPMRKMFFRAIKKLNVKPCQVLFVGDKLIEDIWSAKLFGMKTILIEKKLRIYHKMIFKFKSILGPDFVVNDLSKVLNILKVRQ